MRTTPIVLDPLTACISLRLCPPRRTTVRVSIVVTVDGEEYVATGQTSGYGGAYALRWGLPVMVRGGRILRLGETARSRLTAHVRVERLRGHGALDLRRLLATTAPTPRFTLHNSVAFDAASVVNEDGGDGVVSVSHTSTGSDRAVFAANGNRWDGNGAVASTSMTYGGTGMTEMWDFIYDVATQLAQAGYRLAGQATGAQSVVSTLAGAAVEHSLQVISMTGVDQTTPVGTPQTATGTVGPATVTVTGVAADDMVVDNYFSGGAGDTFTVGANQTQRNTNDAGSSVIRGSTQSGADGGVMSWILTSGDREYGIGAVAFKVAAAGAGAEQFMVAANQFTATGGMIGRVYV